MNTNRKYKDSVFTRYFSDEKKLRLLYNALENANYGEDTEVNIITLEDVLFMNQKNDICFTIKYYILELCLQIAYKTIYPLFQISFETLRQTEKHIANKFLIYLPNKTCLFYFYSFPAQQSIFQGHFYHYYGK